MKINIQQYSKFFFKQLDSSSCGPACLATVIRFCGGKESIEKIKELSGTTQYGTTILGICQAANKFGLHSTAYRADDLEEFDNILIKKNIPIIIQVLLDENYQHYLVIFKKYNNKYIVSDPTQGIVYKTRDEILDIWKDKIFIEFKKSDSFKTKKSKNIEKLKWLKDIIGKDIPILTTTVVIGAIITVLGFSMTLFTQKLIDKILPNKDYESLFSGIVLLSLLLMFGAAFSYLRSFLLLKQGVSFNKGIIGNVINLLIDLPMSFFTSMRTGDLIARMHDIKRIQNTISILFGSIFIDVLFIISALFFTSLYSPKIGLLLLSIIPLYVFLTAKFYKRIKTSQFEVMKSYSSNESQYLETFLNIESIKAGNRETYFSKYNISIYNSYQDKIQLNETLKLNYRFIGNLIKTITTVLVLLFCSFLVITKELSIGSMVAIVSFSGGIIPAINNIAGANIYIQEARVAFSRMYEFVSLSPEKMKSTFKSQTINTLNTISICNLSFSFPGKKASLKNINLNLERGKQIAIMGNSGGGKSTLLKLLMRFYEIEFNKVKINNKVYLENTDISYWRRCLGYVGQNIEIINGSVLENIVFKKVYHIEELQNAQKFIKEMGFDKFINDFPQKEFTIIGESGIDLSGGQKQIIALARALFTKPYGLLLDEFTSHMDRDLEDWALNLINKIKADYIILLVSHRIRPVLLSDYVYLLNDGEIEYKGEPSQLLSEDKISNTPLWNKEFT